MARFGRLTGENTVTDLTGSVTTEPGTLYYLHKTAADENDYPLLYVSGSVPDDAVEARRAIVNLSGTAVRAGVRFRF
jgi:hypothetical protein